MKKEMDIFAEYIETSNKFGEYKKEFGSVLGTVSTVDVPTVACNNGGNNLIEYSTQEIKRELALTQHAYIDGPANGTPHYKAMAVDTNGNEYEIEWVVVEGWENIEDEADMCDWDNPESVERI